MKTFIILLAILVAPLFLHAQNTIGKSKAEIRELVQSNPSFKLSTGENCDTLIFSQGMKTVFSYQNNTCCKSVSTMPLQYLDAVVAHMNEDAYKKVKDGVWVNAAQSVKVQITTNKKYCFIEATAFDKATDQ